MKKICAFCGKEFETKVSRKYCYEDHYDKCIICGKDYFVPYKKLLDKTRSKCCSKKCSSELRKRTNIEKYGGVAPVFSKDVQNKMKETSLKRYGVEHAAQSEDIKEKTKQTNLKKYGVEHYQKTDKAKKDLSNRFKDEEFVNNVVNKRKQTNLLRYGVENPMQNDGVKKKWVENYLSKTGYEYPLQNPDVMNKVKNTLWKNYGVEYPLQNQTVLNKMKNTNLEKYGVENVMQNETILKKALETTLERYGNICYLHSEDGELTTRKTMLERYGATYISKTRKWKQSVMKNPSMVDELMKFRKDMKKYLSTEFEHKPSLIDVSNKIGIDSTTVGQIINDNNLQDYIDYVYSYMERDVMNFLMSLDENIKIETNTHRIITPYELDIYLPDYNIAFECNPTCTHNSTYNVFDENREPIPYNYHKMKSDMCLEKGVFLFHIFGYEWTYKQDIIKSMIRNILNKNDSKIFGRNTVVKKIDGKTSNIFMENNHRQGKVNTSINYGLYYNGELVSVMTFSKSRYSIGKYDEDTYELVRFCNKLNTSVVGGASKLFKAFISDYNPKTIRSFSDIAHTRGNLYETLGFYKCAISKPNYMWVDESTDIPYHRINAQKHNIKKFLKDDSIDIDNKTESEIMEEHGFVRLYDSGTILWEKSFE